MAKNGKNGKKVMTYEEMIEVMTYLTEQDAKHDARFTKMEQQIARNDERYQQRIDETNKRIDEAEKRFNKQIKQVLRINAESTKLLAENTEALQTAQLRQMERTGALEEKVNQLVDAINKLTLNRDRTGKNGNGHKRPSSKK
jgi:translation elongation factor P/translation initiation factor 5A